MNTESLRDLARYSFQLRDNVDPHQGFHFAQMRDQVTRLGKALLDAADDIDQLLVIAAQADAVLNAADTLNEATDHGQDDTGRFPSPSLQEWTTLHENFLTVRKSLRKNLKALRRTP